MKSLAGILLSVLFCTYTSANAQQSAPSSDECNDLDAITYTSPSIVPLKDRIIINKTTDKTPLLSIDEELLKISPQGTSRLIFVDQPDFMKKGPWSTKARIVGNKAHPVNLTIEFRDHANQAIRVDWLNEKLLFLRVWWGRVVSTDLILNVETGERIYAEEANYDNIIMPCDQKRAIQKQ